MLLPDPWIVEYSVANQDFLVHKMSATLEVNIEACRQGIVRDYQLIGSFLTKETAQIFIEGFKSRISSVAAIQVKASDQVKKTEQNLLTYAKAVRLIKREIAAQPHGFRKRMCDQSKLTYHTVVGLLNDTLPFKAWDLVMDILVALGYQVTMTRVEVSQGKGIKNYDREITYLISKPKPNVTTR